jgi:hypothetical protein
MKLVTDCQGLIDIEYTTVELAEPSEILLTSTSKSLVDEVNQSKKADLLIRESCVKFYVTILMLND